MKHPLDLISEYDISRTEAQLLLIVPYIKHKRFSVNMFVRISIKYKINKMFAYNRKVWCYNHLKTLFKNKIFNEELNSNYRAFYTVDKEDIEAIHKGIFEWYAYSGNVSNSNDIKIIYNAYKNNGLISYEYIKLNIIQNQYSRFKILRRLKQKGLLIQINKNKVYKLNDKLLDFLSVI